jgi:hypothetical protein
VPAPQAGRQGSLGLCGAFVAEVVDSTEVVRTLGYPGNDERVWLI